MFARLHKFDGIEVRRRSSIIRQENAHDIVRAVGGVANLAITLDNTVVIVDGCVGIVTVGLVPNPGVVRVKNRPSPEVMPRSCSS